MTLAEPGRTSYRWLIVTLVVASSVYIWYAMNQYGRLNDLNQRQLSNAAAEVKSSLETAVETVAKFNEKWEDTKHKAELCDFDKNQEYLDLPACNKVDWSNLPFVHAVTTPTLGIKASPPRDAAPDQHGQPVMFRFRTDKVLQELAFPDTFGLIFVATEDGHILYQEAPTRRLWLRHLRWGEQTFRDGHADRPATLQIQNLKETLGGEAAWNKLRAISSRTSLELGGVAHQVYLQPLTLENGRRLDLVVGGAVPTSLIVRDALAMDTYLVGALAFLFLLGLLGFPFVKLAWLDPHERFGLWDINRLYVSTGALLVLLTCAALALDGYYRWHAVADGGLEAFAKQIESRFLDEVGSVRDQLAEYDGLVSQRTMTDWEAMPIQTEWFKHKTPVLPVPQRAISLRQVFWLRSADGRQIWKTTPDTIQGKLSLDNRVYFRAVRDENLFQIRSNGRKFFIGPDRSIADGKFYTFVSMQSDLGLDPCPCPEARHSAPSQVAVATAQLLSLDRQPVPAGYGFAVVNREGRVLYHSDRRLSLRENFFEELSEGNQAQARMYAGRGGDLKSGYRERAHEFYFQPIDLNLAAESATAGFYVVAFRDTSIERTVVGHAFVSGLAAPMLLLLSIYVVALAGIAVLSRCTDGNWSAWLWPHGGLDHIYKRQAIAFLLLLVFSATVYVRHGSMRGFLLLPILAPMVGIAIYARGIGTRDTRRRLTACVSHTAALVLLLVCMVIAPTSAMFRLVLSHDFAKLILTERAWIAAQRADVVRAAEVEARADYRPYRDSETRAAARRAYFSCAPSPFDAAPAAASDEPLGHPAFDLEDAAYDGGAIEPPLAAISVVGGAPLRCAPSSRASGAGAMDAGGLTRIGMDASTIAALHWLGDFLPIENERVARQHSQDRVFSYSPDGTLLRTWRISSVSIVGFGLMLALLVWWIRWNTNRLFLADVESEAAAPLGTMEEVWEKRTTDEQMLLLQIAREGIANPYQRQAIRRLLEDGVLRLNPDLQPYSRAFGCFLRDREQQFHEELREWQQASVRQGWRHGRLVLLVSVGALGLLIVATQPALQSSLLGIASGITGVLTAVLKLRDAVGSWFGGKSAGRALHVGEQLG